MNIYLCGLIGSGKTSIGKEIARRLRRPFFDVDQIMEKEAGKRIHDIVAEEGLGQLPGKRIQHLQKAFEA
jgi:shikimate kinase